VDHRRGVHDAEDICGYSPIARGITDLSGACRFGSLWISKPGVGARGDGIVVIAQLPTKVNGERIVQRYIPRPLLIRSGYTFMKRDSLDLRLSLIMRILGICQTARPFNQFFDPQKESSICVD
jgi:hypothetical protein